MTDIYNGIATPDSPLAAKSLEELLNYVADDDHEHRLAAKELLLSAGIARIYPELERGVRDDSKADFRNGAMDILVAYGKESLPYLAKLLLDANEEVRIFACVMLGDIGNRGAVSSLIMALSDNDPNVGHSAAEALGKIGDRSALMPLIDLLKGDFWIQFSAITAIGAMRDYRAVPHLLELLDNEMLTGAVVDALGQIGDPRALQALGKMLPDLDIAVAGQTAKAMVAIYRAAIELLSYKNSLAEYHQPDHLKDVINNEGAKKLLSLLEKSSDKTVLEAVVMLLGWYGDATAVSVFFKLLADDSMLGVVEAGILSLGQSAVELLVDALTDDNDNVKIVALRSLRNLGSLEFPEVINSFLRSPNPELQQEAIEAAKRLPAAIYLQRLVEIVETQPLTVAINAAEALGCYPAASLHEILLSLAAAEAVESRSRGAMLLCHMQEEVDATLLDAFMHDPDAEVRKIAMKAAGIRKAGVAVPRLGEAFADPDIAVRVAAVTAIAEFRTPMLVEDLLAMLGGADEELDYTIIKALGMMTAKGAESALLEYLQKGGLSRRLEYTLLETLGKISATSASELIRCHYLNSTEPDLRRLAVEILGQLGDTNSLQAVESALADSHWSVRVAVLHVLGKLGGVREIPLLIEAMHDPDNMVRKNAILVLGDIRAVSAIPALVQQLADMEMSRHVFVSLLKFGRQALPWLHRHMLKNYTVDIRVRLIDLIGKIGDRRSVEPLMELLSDTNTTIRLAAIDSLAFCFDGMLLKTLTAVKKNDSDAEVRERAELALRTLSMEKYS